MIYVKLLKSQKQLQGLNALTKSMGGQMNIFNNLVVGVIIFNVTVAFVVYKAIDVYRSK